MVDDYAGYAQVARALDVPVSAGEHEYTRWQFRDLIERGQVDIIQPDIIKCGGISEIRKIAALGEAHHKHMVPHQTQPTIGTAANLHFIASLRDANRPQEFSGVNERLNSLFKEPLELQGRLPDRAPEAGAGTGAGRGGLPPRGVVSPHQEPLSGAGRGVLCGVRCSARCGVS